MSLAENLSSIESRICAACERSGRMREEVDLMAVSKRMPAARICEAAELGLSLFGENKVQEGKLKVGACPPNLRWQMIGHLQSNKCRDAVRFFEMLQGVDSVRLAEEINKAADKQAKMMPILMEVNIAGEGSKFGFRIDAVVESLLELNKLERIEVHGLMTLAPWTAEPEKTRPYFARMKELHLACEEALGAPLPTLSMGMSGDFEIAIEEGSTLVRIGTALFGKRP